MHSRARDRDAIAYHYGFPEPFWRVLPGDTMTYSCAYFVSPQEDLSQAQQRKLDQICRKLRLQRGEYVADIGCGWGSFALYAAQQYGVHVTGITINEVQKQIAEERIKQHGLEDRCHIQLCDYRELKPAAYDKIVSVKMFEHVGSACCRNISRACSAPSVRGVYS